MKKVVLALLTPAFFTNAGTLDELKSTPATKYEVGKVQMELGAILFNQKLKGERFKGTDFKFNGFSVEEEPDKLFFKVSLVGKAKHLTPDVCLKMSEGTNALIPKRKVMMELWPRLSEKQYSSLSTQFLIKTELVSKENENFKVSC